MLHTVSLHRGHKSGVVSRFTLHSVCDDKFIPSRIDASFISQQRKVQQQF